MTERDPFDVPPVPPEASPRARLNQGGSGVAIGAFVGLLGAVPLIRWLEGPGQGLETVAFLGLLGSVALHVILHELGHALAAIAVGLRVHAFGVGPFRAELGRSGWNVRLVPGVEGMLGFVLAVPGDRPASRSDHVVFLFGGVLANLLAVAAGWLVLDSGAIGSPAAATIVGTFLLIGGGLALANLVPTSFSGWDSDGRHVLALWRGDESWAVQMRLGAVSTLMRQGVRARDWPEGTLPAGPLDQWRPAVAAAVARCRMLRALDGVDPAGDVADDAARFLAARYREEADGMRQLGALVLAWWLLEVRGDVARARAWSGEVRGAIVDVDASAAALRALLAAAEGDRAAARTALGEADAALARIDSATEGWLEERLADLRARLREEPDRA